MAVSPNIFIATTATVAAAGTSVAPASAPPDNCHTVVIYNEDTSQILFVSLGAPGGALTQATSINVPPSTSITLAIGPLSQRASAGDNFIYDCDAVSAVARITYVNGRPS